MNLQMDPLDNLLTTRQIQMGCGFASNCTRIDGSSQLPTWTANMGTVRFRTRTVANTTFLTRNTA